MRNCSVDDSLPPAFHLLLTLFAPGVIGEVSVCSANSFSKVINNYFIFLLWFRNPYFAYCLVMLTCPGSIRQSQKSLLLSFIFTKTFKKKVTILQLKHFLVSLKRTQSNFYDCFEIAGYIISTLSIAN